MRILVLTPRVPWPPVDGGRIAMARLAASMSRAGAAVEVLSLNPRKDSVASIEAPVPLQAIDIDTSTRVRHLFGANPIVVARFESRAFHEALRATLRRFRPDVVQVESPFLFPYVETVRAESDALVVLRSLNVEFRIWELLARRDFASRLVAASLRAYELRNLDTPDAIVAISEDDARDFRQLGCTRPIHVAPCGVSVPPLVDVLPDPRTVGFIGSLNFRPNQEAVGWIVDELWPRVLERMPDARLRIAGSSAPSWLERRIRDFFVGRVDDANDFMRRASVVIAPLFAGGGMRIKVLEAMALGRPVVATPLGAGGIDVEDVLLAEDAPSFADAIVRLLRDPSLAASLGAAARAKVAERYDDDRIARDVLAFYDINVRAARRTAASPG